MEGNHSLHHLNCQEVEMAEMEDNTKLCPFSQARCAEDKCSLWVQIQTATQIPQLGVVRAQPMNLCVFSALLVVMANLPTMQSLPTLPGFMKG